MKKKGKRTASVLAREIVFREALLPMEASVLPAQKRTYVGALRLVPRAYDAAQDQRAKIWVR